MPGRPPLGQNLDMVSVSVGWCHVEKGFFLVAGGDEMTVEQLLGGFDVASRCWCGLCEQTPLRTGGMETWAGLAIVNQELNYVTVRPPDLGIIGLNGRPSRMAGSVP